jgi:hypothetical protein
MSLVTSKSSVCTEICQALGLKYVKNLDLHISHGGIATITVEYYLEEDGLLKLPAVLKKFELHEVKTETTRRIRVPDKEKILVQEN